MTVPGQTLRIVFSVIDCKFSTIVVDVHEIRTYHRLLALQIGDKYRVTTPVNWKKGEDVIVHPSVTTDEAKTLFPDHTVHKGSRFDPSCLNCNADFETAVVLENHASYG